MIVFTHHCSLVVTSSQKPCREEEATGQYKERLGTLASQLTALREGLGETLCAPSIVRLQQLNVLLSRVLPPLPLLPSFSTHREASIPCQHVTGMMFVLLTRQESAALQDHACIVALQSRRLWRRRGMQAGS